MHTDDPSRGELEESAGLVEPLGTDLVLRGLADGLTIHDAEGRYLYASPAFEELTGFDASELIGRSPYISGFHPDDLAQMVEVQAEGLETGRPWRVLCRIQRSDGAFVWVESAGSAVGTPSGPRFVVTTREAAQLESLVQGLEHERQVKQQLEELAARQARFVTTVSHRARTPLTSLVGMSELLQHRGEEMDVDQRRTLMDRLHANVQRLRQLLEEATEADRLSRADVVLRRRVVDVAELVEATVAEATADGSSVHVEVEPGLHAIVDRAKVERILQILLGNAFKHAGLGASVRVTARGTADGMELLVDDDGPGIRPENRDLVFELFTHGDSESPDPGAGLGLYLVAELAALHRGRVRAEDAPDGGARFRVMLPRPRPDAPVIGHDEEESSRSTAALQPDSHRFVTQLLATLQSRTGMDLAYLSVFDDSHQHVLATAGTAEVAGIEAGRRIPLEETYCAQMVAEELDHVVADTAGDPRTAGLPATKDGLASWIGVPVHLPSGQVIGTLCCAAATPRPELPQAAADEAHSFAAILGGHLAGEGFIDRSAFDASDRVARAMTTPGTITPVFQPIIDLDRGTVAGVEALSRFTDHDRPVDLWFADAARAGLLVDLEVLTASQGLAVLDTLPDDMHVTINVSPSTARSRELAALLDEAPLDRVVLEITEHAAVDNYRPLVDALAPYRAQGLRIAIDDVGTGHAGLGHLIQLNPDIIKVDRSLIENLDTDPAHAIAVGAIVRMAEHLNAILVAEGIERPATLAAVREVGFTHAQGYLLATPDPVPDLNAATQRARQLLPPPATPDRAATTAASSTTTAPARSRCRRCGWSYTPDPSRDEPLCDLCWIVAHQH